MSAPLHLPSRLVPIDFTIVSVTVEAIETMENDHDNPLKIEPFQYDPCRDASLAGSTAASDAGWHHRPMRSPKLNLHSKQREEMLQPGTKSSGAKVSRRSDNLLHM